MTGKSIHPSKPIGRLSTGVAIVASLLLAVCAAPLMAHMPRAQKHERRHEIDHLEDVWRDALIKGDTTAMGSLLADDYMAITPTGTLQTKDETLANLRSGRLRIASIELTDRKVRFYGATALVTSKADVKATNADGDISGSFRYTRVYVQDAAGVWKIVSWEANRIVAPGEHR
jgi:ketosteroid isomerase-like protein